jgi:hypothetical protein
MAPQGKNLSLINTLFEEAVRRHGCDLNSVISDVQAQIARLTGADRAAVDGAFERLMAFRAPQADGRPLH